MRRHLSTTKRAQPPPHFTPIHQGHAGSLMCISPFVTVSLTCTARLWEAATTTAYSLPARLAVEHCVHEARGLDVLPSLVHKFRANGGDEDSAALLERVIYPVSCDWLFVLGARCCVRAPTGERRWYGAAPTASLASCGQGAVHVCCGTEGSNNTMLAKSIGEGNRRASI